MPTVFPPHVPPHTRPRTLLILPPPPGAQVRRRYYAIAGKSAKLLSFIGKPCTERLNARSGGHQFPACNRSVPPEISLLSSATEKPEDSDTFGQMTTELQGPIK